MSEQPGIDSANEPVYPLGERDWVPLGFEHWYREHVGSDTNDVKVGLVLLHKNPKTGRWCMGGITYDIPEAQPYRSHEPDGQLTDVWQLLSRAPLHVEPSLLCKAPMEPIDGQPQECGDHGFIRDGKWVPA